MEYRKFKLYTGCVLPAAAFVIVAGVVFIAMMMSPTGYGIWTALGPLGLGFCISLILISVNRPIHHYILTRELKKDESSIQLCKWVLKNPLVEFYASVDGMWFNGKHYYWEGSLFLRLEDVRLEAANDRSMLVFYFSKSQDRSPGFFNVKVPVPEGKEIQAEEVIRAILKENIILDNQLNRK